MTAITIVKQAQAVHLLTDGAFYNPNGVLTNVGPKVFLMAHANAVLAMRGPDGMLAAIGRTFEFRFLSFDAMVVAGPTVARNVWTDYDGPVLGERDMDLFIVGWSALRSRPEAYLLTSHNAYAASGWPAWQLHELDAITCAPQPAHDAMAALQWKPSDNPELFDPHLDGVLLLEAQHRTKLPLSVLGGDSEPGYGVGGFAQITTVMKSCIMSGTLKRWPDAIGQKISPTL